MNFPLAALATSALLSASVAHAGSLVRFSPESTTWAAVPSQIEIVSNNGPQMKCEAYWTFRSNAHGKIQITALTAPTCGVTFTGFPWTMTAIGGGDGEARNISWTSASGACSELLRWFLYDTNTSILFTTSAKNGCETSGTFTPSPVITMVPK